MIAIVLVLILTVLTVSAVVLISFTKEIMGLLIEMELINETVNWFFVNVGRWIIVVLLFYIAISSLYYFGPAKRKKWKFFSSSTKAPRIGPKKAKPVDLILIPKVFIKIPCENSCTTATISKAKIKYVK